MKKKIGKCNLCFQNKELVKGHILPSWSSRLLGRRGLYVTVDNRNILSWQDGYSNGIPRGSVTEYLFCEQCDNNLGVGEGILREMIHPTSKKPSYVSTVKDFAIELKGEKIIEQFYQAVGGLLLKIFISQQASWENFFLTDEEKELIVNGIINSNLSQNIHIVGMFKLYNLDDFKIGNFTDRIVRLSTMYPHGTQLAYNGPHPDGFSRTVLIFGGVALIITFHPNGYINPILYGPINPNLSPESIKIPIVPMDIRYLIGKEQVAGSSELFEEFFIYSTFFRFLNTFKEISLDSRCPCKVHYTNNEVKEIRNFGDCCYEYWDLISLTI